MKKGILALGMLFVFLLAAAWARAQTVEERIKAIQQEISQLKDQQIEMKKEATAAAAALPTFTYRTGFLGITAADKSWQISWSHEFHVHVYNFTDGADQEGFTTTDVFIRRNRPFVYYCWDDCLYEIGFGIDMDDGDITSSQTSKFLFNLDKINPWLPTIEIADRGLQQVSYVQRSSGSGGVMELTRDMLSDSGYDTLSHAGAGIGYLAKPLGSGDFTLWTEYRVAGANQNTNSGTDRRQFFLKVGTRPFSQLKNKWIQRLDVGLGWIAGGLDSRSATPARRLRLRTDDRIGRIATMDANNINDGGYYALFPGIRWGVGPYTITSEMARSKYDNDGTTAFGGNTVDGFAWSITNELFLWSPKGFLTGSSRTPHSVLMGWSFKRADMDCGTGQDCTPGSSTSSKGHLVKRELDLWYFLRPGLSVGMWWNWWSTPNMPTTLQRDVGCVSNRASERVGKDCDWHSVNLGLRANF
jgi:hypothetical protein